MRPPRMSEDFVPVSDFKAHASEWLRRIGESGQPVVITQHGKPAGVLLSPQSFDRLMERMRFTEAMGQGLADAEAGRVHSHDTVVVEMKKRFHKPAPK